MVATSAVKDLRLRHHSMVATSVVRKGGRDIIKQSRHQMQKKEGRDIIQWSRHQLQGKEVTTSFSCHDIRSKGCEDKSRPNKSLCDIVETTEIATKNRGRDSNNKMVQLT